MPLFKTFFAWSWLLSAMTIEDLGLCSNFAGFTSHLGLVASLTSELKISISDYIIARPSSSRRPMVRTPWIIMWAHDLILVGRLINLSICLSSSKICSLKLRTLSVIIFLCVISIRLPWALIFTPEIMMFTFFKYCHSTLFIRFLISISEIVGGILSFWLITIL